MPWLGHKESVYIDSSGRQYRSYPDTVSVASSKSMHNVGRYRRTGKKYRGTKRKRGGCTIGKVKGLIAEHARRTTEMQWQINTIGSIDIINGNGTLTDLTPQIAQGNQRGQRLGADIAVWRVGCKLMLQGSQNASSLEPDRVRVIITYSNTKLVISEYPDLIQDFWDYEATSGKHPMILHDAIYQVANRTLINVSSVLGVGWGGVPTLKVIELSFPHKGGRQKYGSGGGIQQGFWQMYLLGGYATTAGAKMVGQAKIWYTSG